MDKKALRATLLKARRETAKADKEEIDRAIAAGVLQSKAFIAAKTVFCYCSTEEEIDTKAILRAALNSGKTVCVPRVERAPHIMTARRIVSLEDLSPDPRHGILEPDGQTEIIEPERIDLCIVPALACDLSGYRLGYGGGYYDCFLPQTDAEKIALCAEARLLEQLPRQAYDVPCTRIITERREWIPDEK